VSNFKISQKYLFSLFTCDQILPETDRGQKNFSAFSLESNALKGPLWLARWPAASKLGGGST